MIPTSAGVTPLFALHLELGARMVPFAGWQLPLHYRAGILAEHRQTRTAASLFDVSHMGQAILAGSDAAATLERLSPADLVGLGAGRLRYGLLLNDDGGIEDDFLAGRLAGENGLYWVVNAATRDKDFALARGVGAEVRPLGQAFLALQGPAAAAVLARLAPAAVQMPFFGLCRARLDGIDVVLSRSGYTGEDGFEISLAADKAEALARRLLGEPEVAPAGLGARDLLRLEAGLCLYGHDIDAGVTPAEADLAWTIGKARVAARDFPGAEKILGTPPTRRRVGLTVAGTVPAREDAPVTDGRGRLVGRVTSGGFSPVLGRPIAMAYLDADRAEVGGIVHPQVRGRPLDAAVTALPFVPHRTKTISRRAS